MGCKDKNSIAKWGILPLCSSGRGTRGAER